MRTTITLDDELVERAKFYTGVEETSTLLKLALKHMVEHEAAMRLARLGGTMPDLEDIPRRRLDEDTTAE